MSKIQKPFLKWVGGKTQLLNHIISKFPDEMNNYHEPFIGGGSVLLALLWLINNNKSTIKGKVYAYDSNESLINLYNHIQSSKDELYECIIKYINEFNDITGDIVNRNPICMEDAVTSKESYYYYLRKIYNSTPLNTIQRSALFLFLNKTCFRGLYREGPSGFNVPYGHYKNPSIITKETIDNVSELIKNVVFKACDFTDSLKNIEEGDFVYIDPPYAPETSTSFVKYTDKGFDINCHKTLFESIHNIHKKSIRFVLSNANVELVLKSFEAFKKDEIAAKRAINSKHPESMTKELLIYN